MKTERPLRIPTTSAVTRCSLKHNEYNPRYKKSSKLPISIFTIIVRNTNYIAEISFFGINSTYRHPKKTGFSPGAEHSDSFFRLMMWARADTVAATYHGRPSSEQISTQIPTTNMSKW